MSQVGIPKGTRDFLPWQMRRRNYIFDTIREVFHQFGFVEIQTPSMENLSTLMGKYGEEGDRLLFKILNSGNFLESVNLEEQNLNKLAATMCEKGLRYDLTVPFARFVVQHRQELTMPFKRFQMQPVWRADRPQKGRYREFYQCDADVIGSTSLLNEVELLQMADEVFYRLGIRVTIQTNNRKLLAGIAEYVHCQDRLVDITVAIDKLDKIGWDGVCREMEEKGIPQDSIQKLVPLFKIEGGWESQLSQLKAMLGESEMAMKGIGALETLHEYLKCLDMHNGITINPSLARGLNYYTGTIVEIKALDVAMGSISGGGRYDDLTGIFGLKNMSGVGISFGADRIYDVLTELDAFPKDLGQAAKVLFVNFGTAEQAHCITCAALLRRAGIATLVYPDAAKTKKQMDFANRNNIPYVVFIGEEEIASNTVTLKNMTSGEQEKVPVAEIVSRLHNA